MLSVKCDNCDHLVEVEDTAKEYKLPLLFIFLGLLRFSFMYGTLAIRV